MARKAIVNAGEKYGKLTIVSEAAKGDCGLRKFNCKCDCGKDVCVFYRALVSGNTKSCGCSFRLPIPPKKNCVTCGIEFQPKTKRPNQTYCGHKCAFKAFGSKVLSASLTKESIAKRADLMRDRGQQKTYRKRNGRHEHRVVAEEMIGRKLLPGEVVHHKDENRRNNDPSNLQVLASQAEHARLHRHGVKMERKHKTHCKYGHELTSDNTTIHKSGYVICLTCRRVYDSAWKKAKRKELATIKRGESRV